MESKAVNSRTSEALAFSDNVSSVRTFERTLHSHSKYGERYARLLQAWYQGNSWDLQDELNEDEVTSWESNYELSEDEKSRRAHLLDSPGLVATLERDAKLFDENQALKVEVANEIQVDPTIPSFDLALRRFQWHENDSESRHFARLRRAKPTIFWAKELVGMLAQIVDREEGLDRHPISSLGDGISPAIRALFEQAHMCYLFDFEIPCVITCGALIEEAIESKLGGLIESGDNTVPKKLNRLLQKQPLLSSARSPALDVTRWRNMAVHDPAKYLASGNSKARNALDQTREVLRVFFESERKQEGTK